jgi:hypothetical protein
MATVFVVIIVSWITCFQRGMTMTRQFGIIEGVLLGIMLILWVMFPAQDSNPALFNVIASGPINGTKMMDILVTPS